MYVQIITEKKQKNQNKMETFRYMFNIKEHVFLILLEIRE